jgi:hypothetical protein
MRKFFLFAVLLLLFANIIAQNIKGGIYAGFNLSQVDGDEVYGYHKIGFNGGPTAIIPLRKNFSVSIETIYNQKGSYQKPFKDTSYGMYRLRLNYVEVPLLIHIKDKNKINFGAGLSWGKLVTFKEWEHEIPINWTKDSIPYKKEDICALVDIDLPIYDRFRFNFRYSYSILKIRTRYFPIINTTRYQYNNMLTFRILYVFKDDPKPKRKKENKTKK